MYPVSSRSTNFDKSCNIPFLSLLPFVSLSPAGLGEFRIRDLNDEINKLLREKRRWEERIVELGGPDLGVSVEEESGELA